MATPYTLRRKIYPKTAYRWLNDELEKHGSIKAVADANEVTTAALYKLIGDEDLAIVQRVLKKNTKQNIDA